MLLKLCFVLCLCLAAHLVDAQNANPQPALAAAGNATESQQFCDDVVHVIEEMIANRLPVAAQAEAADLLSETQKGVAYCKAEYSRTSSQYYTCCSGTLRLSTDAIGVMAAKYWSNIGSGASRLSCFW